MQIQSKIKNYSFQFGDDILSDKNKFLDRLEKKFDNLFFFIDENVYNIYREKIELFVDDAKFLIIPADERNKDFIKLPEYYQWLIENNFTRNDILITIGGGILQDISGFIACSLYRGIKWVFIPTTLLSQADSCIGSKTSINFKGSKNLIGSFYPPDQIFIDTNFCKTLTPEYFNSGLGEIIKFHLLSDQDGYGRLKKFLSSENLRESSYFNEIIDSTLQIKYSYFQADEFDSGKRNLLNYGHCFGHALESASNFEISHGEAVIVGMGFANLLALKRGIMSKEKYDEIENILKKYYPKYDYKKISVEDIIYYLKRDKKRVTKDLTMIMLTDIGQAHKFDDLKEQEVRDVYAAEKFY